MSAPPQQMNSQNPTAGLKTHFKTPDGRYKLQYEKTHPAGLLHLSHGKAVSQLTIAYLKEKPANHQPQPAAPAAGVVRSAAARLLGTSNGSRTLSFVPSTKGGSRTGGSYTATSNGATTLNYDGKGTYLIFNSGDTLFISDLNSPDKDPVKAIHFSNSNPICHAFDPDAKDGHDLLIGLHSGDVYSVSLRQQLQDLGKKLVGAQPYNKDGVINTSRCTCVAWVPEGDGSFVVAHADGNLYAYEKNKDGTADCSFPVIKDQTQFVVSHARSSKCNPIARWHVCQGPINNISFSADGTLLATVGRDGYLRVFDYSKEQLIFGGKSYYGALLCCAWSSDGKYILTGGEDDLVQVWSMEDRRIVAWGEGHNSWVSGVAFDSYWLAPNSDEAEENVVYRFGSVGQDTQLLLWDLALEEIGVPLRGPPGGSPTFRNPPGGSPTFRNPPGGSPTFRNPPGGSPTFSNGSHSAHWDTICPMGTLQPAPRMQDVPKLSPLIAHRVHVEPLSGLMFTNDSLLTICREGHIKVWARPDVATTTGQTPRR